MNKIGSDLPENVVSIVIAIIVILAFVFVAYKLFTISQNQELNNAQNLVDLINSKIGALNPGETGHFLIQGFEQKQYTWLLVGWSAGDSQAPDKCNYQSCICSCPLVLVSGFALLTSSDQRNEFARLTSSCQQNGFCRQVSLPKISTTTLPAGFPYIYTDATAKEITINKTKDSINISETTK